MSINPVIDHYIYHLASQIHDRTKLILHLFIRMTDFEHSRYRMRCIQNISPVG